MATKAHKAALARLMRETTNHPRWRTVPEYAGIHDATAAALKAHHSIRPLTGAGLTGWIAKAKDAVGEAVTRVKNFAVGARDGFSPPAAKMLDKYGDWVVSGLTVRRDPIQSALHTAFNLVTLGKWEKARKQYNHDRLFHLGLVLDLTSPKGQHAAVLIEKNAVVSISLPKAVTEDSEILRLPAPSPPVTFAEFVDKAKQRMGPAFHPYSSFSNNCQKFVQGLLAANGALTAGADKFVTQDLEDLIQAQPSYTGAVADRVTDLGARADRLVNGGSKKAQKAKKAPKKAPARGGALGFSKEMRDMGVKTEEDYARFTKWLEADNEQKFAAEAAAREEALKHPHVEGVRPWKFIKLVGETASHVPGLRSFGKVVSKGADVGEEWAGGALNPEGGALFDALRKFLASLLFTHVKPGSEADQLRRNVGQASEWHRETFR